MHDDFERPIRRPRREPELPDVYLPAMWPLDLQRYLVGQYRAWQRRRLYRRLLQLDDQALSARDLKRHQLEALARLPLRQLIQRNECGPGR